MPALAILYTRLFIFAMSSRCGHRLCTDQRFQHFPRQRTDNVARFHTGKDLNGHFGVGWFSNCNNHQKIGRADITVPKISPVNAQTMLPGSAPEKIWTVISGLAITESNICFVWRSMASADERPPDKVCHCARISREKLYERYFTSRIFRQRSNRWCWISLILAIYSNFTPTSCNSLLSPHIFVSRRGVCEPI